MNKSKFINLLFIISNLSLVSCSKEEVKTTSELENTTQINETHNINNNSNSIVVYFSRTNNTKKIANYIVEITNSSKYEITAKIPYSDADINYNDSNSRANKEQNDSSARPEIGGMDIDLSNYNLIYLGYPIWWGQAPKIMYTFVESHDLNGKNIVPFCTSGSSNIGTSATNLAKTTNQGNWKEGKRFSTSANKNDVSNWLNTLNI